MKYKNKTKTAEFHPEHSGNSDSNSLPYFSHDGRNRKMTASEQRMSWKERAGSPEKEERRGRNRTDAGPIAEILLPRDI